MSWAEGFKRDLLHCNSFAFYIWSGKSLKASKDDLSSLNTLKACSQMQVENMPKQEDVGEGDITNAKKPVEGAFHFKLFDIQIGANRLTSVKRARGTFPLTRLFYIIRCFVVKAQRNMKHSRRSLYGMWIWNFYPLMTIWQHLSDITMLVLFLAPSLQLIWSEVCISSRLWWLNRTGLMPSGSGFMYCLENIVMLLSFIIFRLNSLFQPSV